MSKSPFLSAIMWAGVLALLLPVAAMARSLPEFSALVESYGPAVVNISTKQTESARSGPHGLTIPNLPEDFLDRFRQFFGDEGDAMPGDEGQARSLGSGFVVSSDGYLLTASHVVEGADEIIVRTSDRREFVANLVGTDKRSDIALLKVDATGLPAVIMGTAKDLKVGEWVLAIGSPFGFDHSATAGIVSAKGRSLPSENYVPFIQTDVAINPGNSGGPLFNLEGEVVGVNSQIYSRTGSYMGLSFAIPIDVAMDVVEQLKTKGRVSRGWLGVLIQDVTRDLAETFGMDQPRGALVAQVLPDSPAAAAGLQVGDVILTFSGKGVSTSSDLPPLVGATPVGEVAPLEILRRGNKKELGVLIGELPEDEELAMAREPVRAAANRIGLVVKDLADEQREQLGDAAGGVLVEAVEEGPAEKAGIRAGDLILMLASREVADVKQFKQLLDEIEPGRSVAVLVQRGDGRMFFAVRIPKE